MNENGEKGKSRINCLPAAVYRLPNRHEKGHHYPSRRLASAPARRRPMRAVLPDTARRFARAIVMPNLRPPVTTTALALAISRSHSCRAAAGQPLRTVDDAVPDRQHAARGNRESAAQRCGACRQVLPGGRDDQFGFGRDGDLEKCQAVLEAMAEAACRCWCTAKSPIQPWTYSIASACSSSALLAPLIERFTATAGRGGAHHHARGGEIR